MVSPPRIAILGSGALGLYYGGRLARAGQPLTFVARSDLAHLRAHGISVRAGEDRFTLAPESIRVVGDPAECGPVDLVIITLKATANARLPALLPPLLREGTAVLNLQNGLGVDDPVAAIAGAERTMGGICFVCVNRIAAGTVDCTAPGHVVIGEFLGGVRPRTKVVSDLFADAGVRIKISGHLLETRWKKLIWNVPFNGLSVAEDGLTTDRILASPALEAEVRALMGEVQAAAAAYGVTIPDTFIAEQIERTRPMGPYKPSTMLDYLAGRPLELEPIWGEPLRRARARQVPVPHLERLYARLGALANGKP